MLKGIAEIIKAVGRDPRKMLTMVILLVFVSGVTIVDKLLTKSDCEPLIKQNNELVKSQSNLVQENQDIIKKNQELIDGYLQIQKLLPTMKPDTVYITKTSTTIKKSEPIMLSTNTDYLQSSVPNSLNDSVATTTQEINLSATENTYQKIEAPIVKVYKSYKKSNDTIITKLNNLIINKLKKSQ